MHSWYGVELTVLSRLSQAIQKIYLRLGVIRLLAQKNLIPALRRGPPSSLPMFKYLLIKVEDVQLCRNTFDAIRLVDLRIDTLKLLVQWIHWHLFFRSPHFSYVLLPIEERSCI